MIITANRLIFRRSFIEALALEGIFEVVTPEGRFRFTRREFEEEFGNVVRSKSYRVGGVYHYATTPQRALRFLVGEGTEAVGREEATGRFAAPGYILEAMDQARYVGWLHRQQEMVTDDLGAGRFGRRPLQRRWRLTLRERKRLPMNAPSFDSTAYSVRLFMPHGDPDGLRIIDQPNWSGVGVAFPRGAYKEVSKRKEFERTGIYILVGPGPDGGAMPTLYIGQSDRVQTRLDSHHKNKDFWEWAVFFVSKDNALNVAASQYIESRLIERPASAPEW